MIVPSSVTSIGDDFVSECYSLRTIIIPKKLKHLGKFNFKNFSYLTEFIIPSCVSCIGDSTFDKCASLTNVEIPPSVKEIGKNAFFGCTSLKTVNIPSVKNINQFTFGECTSLVEVTISPTVESIVNNAFRGCKSLSKITTSSTVNSLPKIKFENYRSKNRISILLAGDNCVGKTDILRRIIKDKEIKEIMGVDYQWKDYNIDGNKIKLEFLDTKGQERFQFINRQYYHKADSFVVVFDLSSPRSFDIAKRYFNEFQLLGCYSPKFLIGNKCELDHKVSDEEIQKIVEKYNAEYFEVSAEMDENVNETFNYIAKKLFTLLSEEANKLQNLINKINKINNIHVKNNDNENIQQDKCIIF